MEKIKDSTKKYLSHKKMPFLALQNDKGMVLVVALVLMLVITVMGVLAISTSTTDVMIAGNQRIKEMNMTTSEGGKQVSRPIIDDLAYDGDLDKQELSGLVQDQNLGNEMDGDSDMDGSPNTTSAYPTLTNDARANPDVRFSIPTDPDDPNSPTTEVTVDIDFLARKQSAGGGVEFAAGVDGLGHKSVVRYYKTNSISRGQAGSEGVVGAIYRHVKNF